MAKRKGKEAEKDVAEVPVSAAAVTVKKTATPVTRKKLTDQQKAAAVIVSLGTEKASKLYQYMDSEDVEQLTLEVAKLGYLDSDRTEEVLTEYYQMCVTNKAVTEGGPEYAKAVLEKAYGEPKAKTLLEKVTKSMKRQEFSFLQKVSQKDLSSVLQNERPQTIALVLSYVEAKKAAGVIEQLEENKRVKVIESIAKMESASPKAVAIVEAEMSKKFASIIADDSIKVGGVDFTANVMNNLDKDSEKSIFSSLSALNAELADEIRRRMFIFDDIVSMDDRSVQRFLRECDSKNLTLALKGASEEVVGKLLGNMSARMAQAIRDDLAITTNVRSKDVKEAQQRIVTVIRELEERNEIVVMKGGKDDIIA